MTKQTNNNYNNKHYCNLPLTRILLNKLRYSLTFIANIKTISYLESNKKLIANELKPIMIDKYYHMSNTAIKY